MSDLLTHNEAREFLRSGKLPENFPDRLENFLEFEECSNCGGVKDMNVVLRRWFEEEPSPCPSCVDPETDLEWWKRYSLHNKGEAGKL